MMRLERQRSAWSGRRGPRPAELLDRRALLRLGALGAAGALTGAGRGFGSQVERDTSVPVFDAMGEIRDVYGPDLIGEILASGLDAITVTLCDPKTFEQEALDAALEGVAHYDRYIGSLPDLLLKATSVADIERAQRENKLAIFYLFQTSTQFGRDLDRVERFYELGVRSSQITYNYQNWAGAGCKERNDSGLTFFGVELVERMNQVGMLIDLSHAGMRTMADTIRNSKAPVVVSHTACAAVHANPRNTTNYNLRLLADHGGVVGICQIRPFVSDVREGAFEHYLDHIEHAIDIAGIDHVAIGSDRDHRVIELSDEYLAELAAEEGANFDPAEWPLFMDELNGPRRMEVVRAGLESRGLAAGSIEKILGGNLLRLYREVVG